VRKRAVILALTLLVAGTGVSVLLSHLGRWRSGEPHASPSAQAGGRMAHSCSIRIICMAPNVTECVFALGCGERVVGVTDFCSYPPEARTKARVGGLVNPNLERIVALGPDLVIVQGRHEKVAEFCRQRQTPLFRVEMNDLASIYSGLMALGARLGCRSRAERLCAEIRQTLESIDGHVAGKPRPRVFLCLGRRPGSLTGLYTTGAKGFLSEILDLAGRENIFADAVTGYPQVSKEALLKRAPDVIIETYPGQELSDAGRRRLMADWQSMPTLPAVRNGRVYLLTEDYLLVPGPRVVLCARRLAGVLHPGVFGE